MNAKGIAAEGNGELDFSFIFFSDSGNAVQGKPYQMLFDLARFADHNGFTAVWVPERHHHPFGGIFPNPAVLGAALAQITANIRIRAGSVVLPLHHPVSVTESWAMVDNLSGGRVDLAFASGWNPNDFVVAPETYANLRDIWLQRIPLVEKLWRGETVLFANGRGEQTSTPIYPAPVQSKLNVWLTATKREETFALAGARGYNILTMLQGTSLDELAKKIAVYRQARAANNFDPDSGVVTLMLHTLIHRDLEKVQNEVRQPFLEYLKSSFSGHVQALQADERPSEKQIENIIGYSYQRYFNAGALFGTAQSVQKMLQQTRSAGVNEVACLMDFGVGYETVMESLTYLKEMKDIYRAGRRAFFSGAAEAGSVAGKVTQAQASAGEADAGVGLLRELEPYCRLGIVQALQTAGVFRQPGETLRKEELLRQLAVRPDREALFETLVRGLVEGGYLARREDGLTVTAQCEAQALQAGAAQLARQTRNLKVAFVSALRIISRCCAELPALLCGRADIQNLAAIDAQTLDPALLDSALQAERDAGLISRSLLLAVSRTGTACAVAAAKPQINTACSVSTEPPAPVDTRDAQARFAEYCRELIAGTLHIAPERLDMETDLGELGMDSVMAGELITKLSARIGEEISPTLFFVNNTGNALANVIAEEYGEAMSRQFGTPRKVGSEAPAVSAAKPKPQPVPQPAYEPIAIIGISGRYPGAADLEAFWHNLMQGRESVVDLPRARWKDTAFADTVFPQGIVARTACLEDVGAFDAAFFAISPREAASMDPRQRLVLECTWHALEDAGYCARQMAASRTAFYVGIENNEYAELADINEPWYGSSTALCMLANRVSYLFDWRGDSEVVDTSCTSSLVAIHRACKALQGGECDAALVAAASVIYSPKFLLGGLANGMLSAQGRCKPFDENGDGSVTGEGAGALMLKKLNAASADGDHVYGVIRGSVVSHGGRVSSLSAPNARQQSAAIIEACRLAAIDARTITYVEAHGVGLALMDIAEFEGLNKAFSSDQQRQHCALGTLTPNIGNLDPASGMAGIHKIVKAFQHRCLPATINIERINPFIHLDKSPFYINREAQPWQPRDEHGNAMFRRASINTYAWSGVNAHVVLEECGAEALPAAAGKQPAGGPLLFVLSARTTAALRTYIKNYIHFLESNHGPDLPALAYTAQVGRNAMEKRLAIVFDSREYLLGQLQALLQRQPGDTQDVFQCAGDTASANPDPQLLDQWLAQGRLNELANYWLSGGEPDWQKMYGSTGAGKRVALPLYPFERRDFPVVPPHSPAVAQAAMHYGREPGNAGGEQPAATGGGDQVSIYSEVIKETLIRYLALDEDSYSEHKKFTQLGMDSLVAMGFVAQINRRLKLQLTPLEIFNRQTPGALVLYLSENALALSDTGQASSAQLQAVLVPDADAALEGATDLRSQAFALTDLQRAYYLGESGVFALGDMVAHQYFEFEMPRFELARWIDAWDKVTQRHPMLRCYIDAGEQWRCSGGTQHYQPHLYDFSDLSADEAQARIDRQRQRLKSHAPTTRQWPLYEVSVYKMPGDKHIVHYDIALVLLDGLSTWRVFHDLQVYYTDPCAQLKPLRITVSDYMYGLQKFKDSEVYREAKKYWIERLDSLPPAPSLPQRQSIDAIKKHQLTDHCASLSADDWRQLKLAAAVQGVTVSMAVYTVFAAILQRWSENSRFSVNILHFNRLALHAQSHEIAGNLSTTLILPTTLSAKQSFADNALRLQAEFQQAMRYNAFNGLEVQQERNRRLRSVNPGMPVVFTSLCGFQTSDMFEQPIGKLIFDGVQTPQVTLDCAIFEFAETLQIRWAVLDDLFAEGVIAEMLSLKVVLLRDLARDPELWNSPLQVPMPARQAQCRAIANATWQAQDAVAVHRLIFDRVADDPEKTAVISSSVRLSYAQLRRSACALSNRLNTLGARPNRLVAVVMEKGWQQVVAVLGILHAGAAYLPINSSYPQNRIDQLLHLGEVSIAVTQPEADANIAWPQGIERIVIGETLLNDPGAESPEDDSARFSAHLDDLAYVIFTSGSTGTPKGVMMDHRAVVNTLQDINRRFDVGAGDSILAVSDLNFDLSVYDILGLLAAGGTIVMPDARDLRDPQRLSRWVQDYQVTLWNSVPAFMQMLDEYHAGANGDKSITRALRSLRLILLSGDWIPVALALSLSEHLGNAAKPCRLVSLGGATECAIWSIYHPIVNLDQHSEFIPYGKPLANQQFYVLNEELQDCPDYVAGELYIAGEGLAQGYWKETEKTAAAFIRHPQKQMRLYKTGDRGHYLPKGDIRFLGRSDNQIKLQGYRIELGEIEAAINRCEGVHQSVVKVAEPAAGEKQLLAYIVAEASATAATDASGYWENRLLWKQIEAEIRTGLPGYMVPGQAIFTARLPLSANGKVDRNMLPLPRTLQKKTGSGDSYKNSLEKKLAAIWCEVLNLEQVGPQDSFFDLGGHSISAVRLATRIHRQWQQPVTVADLIENDTVSALAALLSGRETSVSAAAAAAARAPAKIVSLNSPRHPRNLILVHAIGGQITSYQALARQWNPAISLHGIMQTGGDEFAAVNMEHLAADYLELIRKAGIEPPYTLGGWSFGGMVAFAMAQLLEAAGQAPDAVIMIDSWTPPYTGKNAAGNRSLDQDSLSTGFVQNLLGNTHANVEQWPVFDLNGESGSFAALREFIKQYRGEELTLGNEQLSILYRQYCCNMETMLSYNPGKLSSPVHLIKAAEVNVEAFGQHPASGMECLGWSNFADVYIHPIAGNHYSIFEAEHLETLSAELQTILAPVKGKLLSRDSRASAKILSAT